MASDNESNALKTFIQTASPFITFAFGLIAYIYTRGMSEAQEKFLKYEAKQEQRDKDAATLSNAVLIQDGRIGRTEKDVERNSGRLDKVEQRQSDLEKTFILSNATRR